MNTQKKWFGSATLLIGIVIVSLAVLSGCDRDHHVRYRRHRPVVVRECRRPGPVIVHRDRRPSRFDAHHSDRHAPRAPERFDRGRGRERGRRGR